MTLTDKQMIEYLHRSYTAVDGLWFMKTEDAYDFETALGIDEKVWKIMPKIQARKLKELTGLSSGLDDLYECFKLKLLLDRIAFRADREAVGSGFTITITECHWLELLRNSQREHLAERVGSCICTAEYATWAQEFGPDIRFAMQSQLCKNDKSCVVRFSR